MNMDFDIEGTTVEMTPPKWVGIARLYFEVLKNGNAEGQQSAEEDLLVMAKLADQRNEVATLLATMEQCIGEYEDSQEDRLRKQDNLVALLQQALEVVRA